MVCKLCETKEATKTVITKITKSGNKTVELCDECFCIHNVLENHNWRFFVTSETKDNERVWFLTIPLTDKRYQLQNLTASEVKSTIMRLV